ncbi:MAG: DUF4351 domain-containing protein, partial [Methylococcales bacterium]|nr:DUF4351 domain-containing protein [Methylococcales bacterium]
SVEALYPEYYLIKVHRFNDIAKDTLDEWIYFLKHEQLPEHYSAKGLKQAEETLSILKLPEAERRAYERYQDDLHYQASLFESSYGDGYRVGKEEGRKQGKEEGKTEGQMQLLQRLLVKRFGPLPQDIEARIHAASSAQLEHWSERLFEVTTLAELFEG